MADKRSIATKLALEGEKTFKKAISGINTDLAVLGSEMGKVTNQFGANEKSVESLTAKQDVLARQVDVQKQKIEELKSALTASAAAFGENDKRTKEWQIALNRAEGDLSKAERSLADTKSELDGLGKKAKDGGEAVEDAGEKAAKSGSDAETGQSGWSKLGSGLSKAGELAAKAATALGVAAVGAAAAVAGMTVKAAYNADEINTLAKQTGLSTEEIQKFMYASEQIDVPLETLTGGLAKLTKNMSKAKGGSKDTQEAFTALGVSITDSNGELRDNEDVFNESVAALGKISNETERDAMAMTLFGKSAQDLNPLILGGADALKQLGQEASDAGLILGQDSLDNLNLLADAVDTFKATAAGGGSLFATAFAGPIAEGINTVNGYMQSLSTAFASGGLGAVSEQIGVIMTDVITKLNETLPQILEFGLGIVTTIIEGVSENLPELVSGATDMIMTVVDTLLGMLPEILKMGLEIITELAFGIANALPTLIPTIVDTVLTITETLINNIDMLIDASIAIIIALADGLIAAMPRLIEKAPIIIASLLTALAENMPKLILAGMDLVLKLASGIVTSIPKILATVPQIITSVVDSFKTYYGRIFDIGKNIVSGVWDGIKSMSAKFTQQVRDFFANIVDGAKEVLGIHSPSRVFAGIGQNMALGMGVGFEDAMDGVAKRINSTTETAIPTVTVGTGSASVAGAVTVNSNLYLDGKQVTRSTSRSQSTRNKSYARAVGVPA